MIKRANKNINAKMLRNIFLIALLCTVYLSFIDKAHAVCSNPSAAQGVMIYNEDENVPQYCDDTNWIAMGPLGGVDIKAVNFNGTSNLLSRTVELENATDCKQWSGSLWFKRASSGAITQIYDTPGAAHFISFGVDDRFYLVGRNGAVDILSVVSTSAFSDTDWHHVMWSFDMSNASRRHLYIDEIDELNVSIYTDDDLNNTPGVHYIGRQDSGPSGFFDGDMAEYWFDYCSYIDLSIEENRRKFIQENGRPAFLGKSGQLPTGSVPDIYFSGDNVEFLENKGDGGAFNNFGGFTNATTEPDDLDTGIKFFSTSGSIQSGTQLAKAEEIVVQGDYAFVAAHDNNRMTVLDISDPTSPTIVSDEQNITVPEDIDMHKNHVFIMSDDGATGTLHIIDISNKSDPVEVASITHAQYGSAFGIVYNEADQHIYSTHGGTLDHIVATDVSDPTNPSRIAAFAPGTIDDPTMIAVQGDWAFMTSSSDHVTSIDISDPSSMSLGQNFSDADLPGPRGIFVEGDYAYIANRVVTGRMTIVDISNPSAMSVSGSVSDGTSLRYSEGVYKQGNYVYTGAQQGESYFTIIDVTNKASPQIIASLEDTTNFVSVDGILVRGKYAYITGSNGADRVTVIDLGSFTNCINPPGVAGTLYYNEDENIPQYCDGDHWVAMSEDSLAKGLVGHWKFDEASGSFVDSTGSGNDGTGSNSPQYQSSGIINYAAGFPGTDDHIIIPDPNDVYETAPMTVSFWTKFDILATTKGESQYLLRRYHAGSSPFDSWNINLNQGAGDEIRAVIADSSGSQYYLNADSASVIDQWYHVVLVIDESYNATLYIDTVAQADTETPGSLYNSTGSDLYVATNNTSGSNDLDGSIDDLRIYNRVLSEAEINVLYRRGLKDDGLVAYWPLDEGGGPAVNDLVGGHIGFSSGGVTFNSSAGLIKGALSFDGVDGMIDVGTPSELQILGNVSVSAWINIDTIQDNEVIYYMGGGDLETEVTNELYLLRWNTAAGNDLEYKHEYGAVGTNSNHVFDTNLSASTWYHTVLVRDGSAQTVALYLDGVQSGVPLSYTNAPTGGADSFFAIGSDGIDFSDGRVDDLRIYDRVLSDAEISKLYNDGNNNLVSNDCTSPNGATGTMIYNSDDTLVQYLSLIHI